MKSLKSFFLILSMLFLIIAGCAQAQTAVDVEKSGKATLITFDSICDSTTAVTTSNWFSLGDVLSHSLITYPIYYTKIQSSADGKPHVTVTVEGSNDLSNVVIVDTVGTVGDSLETIYNGNTNFNNKKFWYYRLKYTGTGSGAYKNRADTILRTDLVFYKPQD